MSTYQDEVFEQRNCKECGNAFEITVSEKNYFEEHVDGNGNPLTLPKRCKSCRSKRRNAAAA